MPSSAEFKFNFTEAFKNQLAGTISELTPAPLNAEEVKALQTDAGTYQLYHKGELVYVGKAEKEKPYVGKGTQAQRGLRGRLEQHRCKISGRQTIDLADMTFTAVYVEPDLSAVAEELLIKRYRVNGGIPWNFGGFGGNDVGRERDTTALNTQNFDARFPIRLDWRCGVADGDYKIVDLLRGLKENLPYVFRYQDGTRRPANQPADFQHTSVRVTSTMPADEVFEVIIQALPEGWQITALHGYVIMYRERKDGYPSPLRVYRR